MFLCAQVMWCRMERLIVRFNCDHRSTLKYFVLLEIILKCVNLNRRFEEL